MVPEEPPVVAEAVPLVRRPSTDLRRPEVAPEAEYPDDEPEFYFWWLYYLGSGTMVNYFLSTADVCSILLWL